MRIELQNEAGQPVPGFSLDDSDVIYGDDISRIVKWKQGSDVSSLTGTTVRLRCLMNESDLYSVRFIGEPSNQRK